MISPKEEIVKALQDLKSHVTEKKDAAAADTTDGSARPTVLQEIEAVLEKLISLLTGGGAS